VQAAEVCTDVHRDCLHLLIGSESNHVCPQVYVAYTEGMNFKKALAGLLGLNADASIGSCLQRIRSFLTGQQTYMHPESKVLGEQRQPNLVCIDPELHAFVVLPLTVVTLTVTLTVHP